MTIRGGSPAPLANLRGTVAATASLAAGVLALAGAVPSPAQAAFATGLGGEEYVSANPAVRDLWLDRTVAARARIIRINVPWRAVATRTPSDPANPADPAYNFSWLDAAIRDAAAHGIRPMLTIAFAPDYAEAPNRPAGVRAGTWQPNPDAVGEFARAIASRYSGSFAGLPRVRFFQLWNEPNLAVYLAPQWSGGKLVAARHYRRMLNAFYGAVRSVRRNNVVITAGTGPYGEAPGGERSRPLAFWREALCLRRKGRGRFAGTSCRPKPRFDVLAHHAINTSGGPRESAVHRDDVSTPDLGGLRETLRAAERLRKIAGKRKRHQLWVTEIWWESNPPDTFRGLSLAKHARYLEETLYLLWKGGAKVVINLLIRDQPYDPQEPLATTEAGLYFVDGSPKPALQAYRFPFVTERRSKRTVLAWGKSPVAGRLAIERRQGGGWRRVAGERVGAGRVFTEELRLSGKVSLRARVGGEESLVWRQRR